MTPVDPRLADALAGRYVVERELGRGGMAAVYLAHDVRHKRRVALKVLDPVLGSILGPERFLREIETAAALQHPNILTVHDSGEAAGLLWYTMPYVEGESLRDRLRREGRLPVAEAVRLGQEIAGALGAAHARGVVHRDIKPENVLLSHGHALVADFGIARTPRTGEGGSLTQTGLSIGTPAYMSPEQVLGERELDGRSDIYALGCLTYELLAGEPPYSGNTPQAVVSKHLAAPIPELRQARPDVPFPIAAAVARAMAKTPDERFGSAAEFADALAGRITASAPRSARLARWPAARLVWPALAVAALVAAAAVRLWHARPAPPVAAGPLRLAVLPFWNIGDSSGAYLTDGLVDGVRGRLAALPALRVIASTSTESYRDSQKPVRQIGRELDVSYLVVGKVQWGRGAGGTPSLQVTPELIEAETGVTRWQNPLQVRPDDVLQVQAEIADRVAQALGVSAPPSHSTDVLTRDPEAYDAFLRAQELIRQVEHYAAPERQIEPAIALYRRALTMDPAFALAKVRLAYALTSAARIAGDRTRYHEPDSLLDAVLLERPRFAAALIVQATLREYQGDHAAATRLAREAAALQPNDAGILGELAWRQALELDSETVRTAARAVALAPRDPEMLRTVIAATFLFRHFDTLTEYCDRLIALDPTDFMSYLNKAMADVYARGDTASALAALRQGETMAGNVPRPLAWGYAEAGPGGWERWERMSLADLGPALASDTVDYYFWRALIESAQGRRGVAGTFADSVIRVVGRLNLVGWKAAVARAQRGYAYALRGDHQAAERDIAQAELGLASELPAVREQSREELIAALAEAGDFERALAMSRRLLEVPTGVTRHGLRLSPAFAKLWGRPEFERLVADTTLPP